MSQHFSPKIVTNGLVYSLDGANVKSYRGPEGTNIARAIGTSFADTSVTGFRARSSDEIADIPGLGRVPVKATYIYNENPPGYCCPNLYTFHGGSLIPISGNTTYTYAIIYKTLTGYTHPNYMYRYEYNSSQAYLTEAGVHSTANRIHLGDGWYYAWGQFTSQPTAAFMWAYLFHYEYSTHNTVYMAAASITQGTYVHPFNRLLPPETTRGSTVATGGGGFNLMRNGGDAQMFNSPSFSLDGLGSVVFDGTNDYADFSVTGLGNVATVEMWVKLGAGYAGKMFMGWLSYDVYCADGHIGYNTGNSDLYGITNTTVTNLNLVGRWAHYIFEMRSDVAYTNNKIYINGNVQTLQQVYNVEAAGSRNFNSGNGRIACWRNDTNYPMPMSLGVFNVYNRSLTQDEVRQNYNALRGRFGA